MSTSLRTMRSRYAFAVAILALLPGFMGCMSGARIATSADRYHLDLAMSPDTHLLSARAQLDLVRTDAGGSTGESAIMAFRLHPNLEVQRVQAGGARFVRHWIDRSSRKRDQSGDQAGLVPTTHFVQLADVHDTFTLTVDYEGRVFQDVSAGERPGEIHNFEMRAHIGPEGIYLANGNWYPEPVGVDDAAPHAVDFSVAVAPVPGMALAVGAERTATLASDGDSARWRSPYPIDGLVIAGGPHEVHYTAHGDVGIAVHLKPEQAPYAEGLLEAAKNILDRYEPLIGPYPAREYKIVDNFFSSGFAFPTMTLLSSAVIEMGERSQTTHGYLDHEMLHSWWGNGVLVDPRDGNWCESLTSYATNYYGYVLDGDLGEARRKRRNYAHFLTRIKSEKDKPLGAYGMPDGCGRAIAYNKGAAVFHMLAREMGQDSFWAAMRRFDHEYLGKHANWADIRRVCEEASGRDLSVFFDQWVRRGGAPSISVESADYDSSAQELRVTIRQGDPVFTVDVPIRVGVVSRTEDHVVRLDTSTSDIRIPMTETPLTIELDPDYHVFRRVSLEQIIPTTAATRRGEAFTSVVPEGEVPKAYAQLRGIFESSFKEHERLSKTIGALAEGDLANRCVLVLGDAVRAPYVSGFLEAIEFPVRWTENGFEISGVLYDDPSDAVLCTVRHPGVLGGGVTVVYANSEEAIPRPFALPMYEHSLVVFENGRPSVRLDFEKRDIVAVRRD